jgi:GT2 family glycosyltransferase
MSCIVSGIVVAYGDEGMLGRCLRSLDAALGRVDGETELIVVLNRPIDPERCPLAGPWIVVEQPENVGFAGGVAAGLARAAGDWIAVVNDDCVVEEDAVTAMLAAAAARADVGAVAPRVLFADRDVVNSAGIEIDRLGVAHERRIGTPASAAQGPVVDVFGASATAALYRREMLDDVGGFDESFFAYLEDADLAWRAQMARWRTVYVPQATVRHHHSGTLGHRSPEKFFLVGRNRVRMLAKNATGTQLTRHALAIVAYDVAYVLYAALRSRTLAPLRGRVAGLREWHSYRGRGRASRRPIALTRGPGIRAALARDRSYGGRRLAARGLPGGTSSVR